MPVVGEERIVNIDGRVGKLQCRLRFAGEVHAPDGVAPLRLSDRICAVGLAWTHRDRRENVLVGERLILEQPLPGPRLRIADVILDLVGAGGIAPGEAGLSTLVGDEAAPGTVTFQAQAHLASDHVQVVEVGELAHRPATELPTSVHDGAVLCGEQVALGRDEDGVGFSRVPIDDLILQLAARGGGALSLDQHLQVLAVRIDCRQSCGDVDGAQVVNRSAQAAEQPLRRRPSAPFDEELIVRGTAHDQMQRRAVLREVSHHRYPQALYGGQYSEITTVGGDRSRDDLFTASEGRDGWRAVVWQDAGWRRLASRHHRHKR